MHRLLAGIFLLTTLAAQQRPAPPPFSEQEKPIRETIRTLRGLPDDKRAKETLRLALEIRALPVTSLYRLNLASSLANLSTEGDFGRKTLEEVATTLATVLRDKPVPPDKNGAPAAPYSTLAQISRYEGIAVTLDDPSYASALARLESVDQSRAEADFTLTDLAGKGWHLRELQGKVVLVNFWATWCPPCRKEMPDLDALYRKHQKKGFVILALSDEEEAKVKPFIQQSGYRYPVLLDPGGTVAKRFVVDGIPKSFLFDRTGKLVAQSIDMRTRQQFEAMLAKAGL
jgi:peroxiredoxin